jgi:hypothetical protein
MSKVISLSLNQILNRGREGRIHVGRHLYIEPAPVVECIDGYQVSIQCSSHSYSIPREDFKDVSNYISFELGFPNMSDELLDEYAEDRTDFTETVYPYVPRNIVEALLLKHGGVV